MNFLGEDHAVQKNADFETTALAPIEPVSSQRSEEIKAKAGSAPKKQL